jgi:hypothetical protein
MRQMKSDVRHPHRACDEVDFSVTIEVVTCRRVAALVQVHDELEEPASIHGFLLDTIPRGVQVSTDEDVVARGPRVVDELGQVSLRLQYGRLPSCPLCMPMWVEVDCYHQSRHC